LANGVVSAGNLKRVRARLTPTNPNGPQTRMSYDAYGNLVGVTDANGWTTATVYDSRALYPLGVLNPFWHATTTEVDYRWGLPTRLTDPNNAVTSFAYDNAGRRTCVARPGDSLANCSIAYTYHFASQAGELSWVEETERQDSPHPPLTTRHYVDALGRPRFTDTFRVVDGAPTTVRSNHVVYDPAGRVRTLYHYLAGAGAPEQRRDHGRPHLNGSAFIDPLGRVYRTINADQTTRRTIYAAALTTVYDEEGQRTDTTTDPFGRAVGQTVYSGASPYVTTERSYDGLGRLLTLRQGGTLLRTISYDSLGRKTQLIDQGLGYGAMLDGVGNLRWQDDPRAAHHVEFCYDAINRPTRHCSYPNDSASLSSCSNANACSDPAAITYRYDESAVANARGRLTAVDDASGSTHVDEYDARGRQRRFTTAIDLVDGSRHAHFAFAYDRNDRVAATTYPDGESVFTEYDDGGQPIALRNQSNAFYVTDARYDVFGRPTRIDHVNGVSDTRTYGGADQRHRLTALASAKGATRHLDLSYFHYTPRGLLSFMIDGRNLNGELSNSAAYTYDALGRLTNFDSSYNPLDAAFSHDVMGNLTRRGDRYLRYDNAAKPHQATTLHVGSPNATAQPVAYDANGNRTGKGAQSYSYDSADRLARIATAGGEVELTYDYRGDQVGKVVTDAATVRTSRFYGALAETSGGTLTKWYSLTAARRLAVEQLHCLGNCRDRKLRLADRGTDAGAHLARRRSGICARRRRVRTALPCRRAVRCAVAEETRRRHRRSPRPRAAACARLPHRHPARVGRRRARARTGGRPAGRAALSSRSSRLDAGGHRLRRRYCRAGTLPALRLAARTLESQQPAHRQPGRRQPARVHRLPERAALGSAIRGRALLRSGRRHVSHSGSGDAVRQSLQLRRRRSGELARPERRGLRHCVSHCARHQCRRVRGRQRDHRRRAGLPASAIGRAAVGGAIAGAVGVGLGVVASVATLGAGAMAGTLAPGVSIASGAQQIGEVAWRSAFSSTVANAAGQTAAAFGAPDEAVTGIGIAAGLLSSVAYDRVVPSDGGVSTADTPAQAQTVSSTRTHTQVTLNAASRSSLRNGAAEILDANLARDRGVWNLLNNEDHFDLGAQRAFERFRSEAFTAAREGDATRFLAKTGAALHHLQDQYALGHMFPGTSYLKGPVGATFRFIVHNTVGGEVTFAQASQNASMRFLESLPSPPI
jgi:YD repeat-containing protein